MTTWTDERIAQLRALHDKQLSFSRIAAELGISRAACIGKAHQLGLSSRERGSNVVVTRRKRRVPTGRVERKTPFRRPPSLLEQAETMSDGMVDLPPDQSIFAVTFGQLRERHCHFPLGDPKHPDFKYCGDKKIGKSPYCPRHHRLCYTVPVRRSA